jgi:hypothetical protein
MLQIGPMKSRLFLVRFSTFFTDRYLFKLFENKICKPNECVHHRQTILNT